MPSLSKNQQQAAGMALAAKRGEMSPSKLEGAAKEMYDSMDEKQLHDFAKTKHEGLPEKVQQEESKSYDEITDHRLLRNEIYRMLHAGGIEFPDDVEDRAQTILEGHKMRYDPKDTIMSVFRDLHNEAIPKMLDMLRNTEGVASEKDAQKHADKIWEFITKAEQGIFSYLKTNKLLFPKHPNDYKG